MRKVVLVRTSRSDHGTFGRLITGGFMCHAIELPWRQNRSNVSCIPAGTYQVEVRRSSKFGLTYWVKDVEGRSLVLFHSGNFAGDVYKNLKTHSHGCILPGSRPGSIGGQKAVLLSRPTIQKFMKHMNNEPFELEIIEAISC